MPEHHKNFCTLCSAACRPNEVLSQQAAATIMIVSPLVLGLKTRAPNAASVNEFGDPEEVLLGLHEFSGS